ncbi:STAS domain-containing protein [Actinomycetospora atypica]|uniref:STAS domain-containing protein n=1 Tax=Actinomycetospora atypica TaxID=1290095 RepID=A0ABV9YHK4_9PSEU
MTLGEIPLPDDLQVDVAHPRPGVVRVVVAGELDGLTAPRLAAGLDAELGVAPPTVVALDLSGLGFCSVAGLAVLLRARERAAAAGHTVVLTRFSRAVHRVVRACGLGAVLVEEPDA